MNLDQIEKFENLTFAQWVALGTKLGGVEAVKAILYGTSVVSVEVIRYLSDWSYATVGGVKCNPHEFFQTREGLHVLDGFRDNILAVATNKVITTNKTTFGYADLAQPANDAEIVAEMPENHVFEDVDVFLSHLATLIYTQQDGGEGWLLNNGRLNIFYVRVGSEVFAVYVGWGYDGSCSRWDCRAYHLDGGRFVGRFVAGTRVFSNC